MIHLNLRETEDWGSIKLDEWMSREIGAVDYWQEHKTNRVPQFNEFYNIDYFEFRRRVKKIANDVHNRMGLSVIYQGRNQTDFIGYINDDDWILPIDDDDWLHPNIRKVVDGIRGYDYMCWDALVLATSQCYHIEQYSTWSKRFPICTNAYMLRAGFLKTLEPWQASQLLFGHTQSMDRTIKWGGRILDRRSDLCLSAYNRHLAAMSYMNSSSHSFDDSIPINQVPELKKDWQWAEPEFCLMVELVQSLRQPLPQTLILHL